MYKRRIVEVNGDTSEISFPIVKFPPFNLRALLIEKDPVVWLHCIETYVIYIEFLLHQNNVENLDALTYNNLCLFVRSYLSEVAEDEERLLSLGMNHDVSEQLYLLRTYIFVLIKKCGLLHLQIFNETLWNFVKFYVAKNPDTVRSLILGTLQPQINTQKAKLNRVSQIQDCLKQKVESGEFTRVDLKTFEMLLGQKSLKSNKFPKKFLTATWLETLESWWSKGTGKFSGIAKELEIVSLMSVSVNDICEVMRELGIGAIDTLLLYPLLGSLVTNEKFQERKPELISKLPYLQLGGSADLRDEMPGAETAEEDVLTLSELFPHLTKNQLSKVLQRFDGNMELATNTLLEDPSTAVDIPREGSDDENDIYNNDTTKQVDLEDARTNSKRKKTGSSKHVPDELRNKTLTRALELLYAKDEDEYDDTYDEAEASSSLAKISVSDNGDTPNNNSEGNGSATSKYDQIEGYLWELLKQDKSLFERNKRGSKSRKDIRSETGWSDEQIEGWARMLERSPLRAKILEEKFMFKGNFKTGKTAYVKNSSDNHAPVTQKDIQKPVGPKQKPVVDKKKQQARNEKHKSSRGNHSRKTGHDKKMARTAA